MNTIRLLALSLAMVFSLLIAADANAGDYCGGSRFFGLRAGYGAGGSLYGLGFVPVPPYYSIHPPVYYSFPVRRPYGYSPFPAPSTIGAVELQRVSRAIIINPFYQKEERMADAALDEKMAVVKPVPKMIINPYFQPETENDQLVKRLGECVR